MISFFSGPTAREFYLSHVQSASQARRTREFHLDLLRTWEELTENPGIRAIRTETIWAFREECIRSGLANPTINKKLRSLRIILKRAFKLERIPKMPDIEMLREAEPEPRIASDQELCAIYWACSSARWPRSAECDEIHPGNYWRALVVTLFNIGLRLGEVTSLRFTDVDFERGTISVRSSKTKKFRQKPLHQAVVEHLESIRGNRLLIFGKTASHKQRYNQWDAIQKHAGLGEPFLNFHDLRHTCGTAFFEQSPAPRRKCLATRAWKRPDGVMPTSRVTRGRLPSRSNSRWRFTAAAASKHRSRSGSGVGVGGRGQRVRAARRVRKTPLARGR